MIRTGLLCVPVYDETASDAVRKLLLGVAPSAVIIIARHVASQRYLVEEVLRQWCDAEELDLILTIGGALPAPGPSASEIVPEATTAVIERPMPALNQTMRALAARETPLALLDRGVAGIRGRTLIVNLPAGAKAASLFLSAIAAVLPAVIAHLQDDPTAPSLEATLAAQTMPGLSQAAASAAALDAPAPVAARRPARSLDPAEFAAFLQRNAGKDTPNAP
jgi:molybdopterin biosynthesis enzyme MoaB